MFFTYQVKNRGGGLLSGTSRDWALGVARIPYVYWWLYQLNLAMQKKKQFRQQPFEYVFEILVWNLYFQSRTETFARWDRGRVSPRQRADRTHRGRSLGVPQGKSRLRMMLRCNLFFCQSCFTFQPPTGCCWTDDDWMVGLLRTPRPLAIYIVNSKRKENHFAVNFINTAETPLQCDIWAQWLLFCDDVHFNYSPTEHWRIWNWFSCLRPKVGWCALCMTNDWPSAKMHWSIIFSSVLTNA